MRLPSLSPNDPDQLPGRLQRPQPAPNLKAGRQLIRVLQTWQQLPELSLPAQGCRVKHVVHVSVSHVPPDVWATFDLPLPADGLLATVTLLQEGQQQRFRLPYVLGNWAYSILAYRVRGVPILPSDVEFGHRDDGSPSVYVRLPQWASEKENVASNELSSSSWPPEVPQEAS